MQQCRREFHSQLAGVLSLRDRPGRPFLASCTFAYGTVWGKLLLGAGRQLRPTPPQQNRRTHIILFVGPKNRGAVGVGTRRRRQRGQKAMGMECPLTSRLGDLGHRL